MEFLKYIKNKTLLIVPNVQKKKILEELDTYDALFNIKIMSFQEFKKKYYFDYTKETLLYMVRKYDLKIDVARVYIENMYSLSGLYTSSDKLNELTLMKSNLLDHNLLVKDPFFVESLKSYSILFYGYDYYLKEEEMLIEELKKITDVQVFRKAVYPFKKLAAYEFLTIDEEVEYVLQRIIGLLEKNVPFSQIKLGEVPKEYTEPLSRLAKFYHLPIGLSSKVSLYETLIGKRAIYYLEEGYDFYDTVNFLEKEYPEEEEILSLLVSIFNQYAFFQEDKKNILEFIIDDIKNTNLKTSRMKDEIEIISLKHNMIDPDVHLFILGFNNGNYPVVLKDEEFISDFYKEEWGFTTTTDLNKLERKSFMNLLFSLSNVVITYKLRTSFDEYYPSTYITDYDMEVEKPSISDGKVHYSKIQDTLRLTSMLDKYVQFGQKNESLENYYTNLKIPYKKYDHSYSPVDTSDLYQYLNQKLLLSYSAMDNFYHCKFRYYLANILKIQKYEASLSQNIGTVFHEILSKCFNEDFDFDKEYDELIKKYSTGFKDSFYFQKLKKELQLVITVIKKQNCILGFTNSYYEEKIYVLRKQKIDTTFMGIIDKILEFYHDGEKVCGIVDYKTGTPSLDLTMVPFGLSMQLPVYMYLLRNSKKYSDSKICGIYLQKILNTIPLNTEDIMAFKEDSLRLSGYSIDSLDILSHFDPTYENSEVIRSLKMGKNGWYRYAKILSDEQIDGLIKITDEKINSATESILNADFTIDPKRVDKQNIGCEFCKFQDICYMKEKDIVNLKPYKDLSFLNNDEEKGGEDNA